MRIRNPKSTIQRIVGGFQKQVDDLTNAAQVLESENDAIEDQINELRTQAAGNNASICRAKLLADRIKEMIG